MTDSSSVLLSTRAEMYGSLELLTSPWHYHIKIMRLTGFINRKNWQRISNYSSVSGHKIKIKNKVYRLNANIENFLTLAYTNRIIVIWLCWS